MSKRTAIIDWAIPLVVLAALTIVVRLSSIDLSAEARFYVSGEGWPIGSAQPWDFLYHYGVIPAWIVSLSALAVLVASIWKRDLAPRRRVAVFLVAVMVTAPGFLVNTVFKQNWGRPRPRDVQAFGGERAFAPVWRKGEAGSGNSFPSGHSATAFYLLVPWFVARRRSRARGIAWLTAGLTYGTLMGIARMAQGAHFPSDVLWSAGLVYLTALSFYYGLGLDRGELPSFAWVC